MWIWEDDTHNYRNTETGQFVSQNDILRLSGERIDRTFPVSDQLVSMLVNGQLNVRDWELLMRQELKAAYIQQYLLGRGGLGAMTQADWGSIGGMLREQYRYLNNFAREIKAGGLTEGQIRVRARMYFASSREAFSRARSRAMGWPQLPDYPGSGNTFCLTNCRCDWSGDEVEPGVWEMTWNLDPNPAVEHCTGPGEDKEGRPFGCVERSIKWNPLILRT
jgi:hypothetical protein